SCRSSMPKRLEKSPEMIPSASNSSRPGRPAVAARNRNRMLLERDCLECIPRLVERDADRFELVYVDPPFNAGGKRRARGKKGDRVTGEAAYDDAWGGIEMFLDMLEPRLAVIRDAVAGAESLWLHLDHRTVHEAKLAADRVFGRRAFRGEVIWVPGNGGRARGGPSVT